MKYIKFRVADRAYAIDIAQVSEVVRMGEIVPVPKAARFVKGVIRLRGRAIPLISLRERFEIESEWSGSSDRILVGEIAGKALGIIVDEVEGVVGIEEERIEAQSPVLKNAGYLSGIGKVESGLVLIVDLERLLNGDEKRNIPDQEMAMNAGETGP